MKKNNRAMKVCEQSGHNYKPTPTITLKGSWLEEWGFAMGTPISVGCEEGRLTITLREEVSYIETFEEQMARAIAEKKGEY